EEAVVLLSRDGWIKRQTQVKDPAATRLREGDALVAILPGTTRDRLVLFSTHGSLYVLRVADLPATTGYGEPVQSILKFGDGERVVTARLVREPEPAEGQQSLPGLGGAEAPSFLVATAKGYGFRCTPDLSETTRAGRRLARVAGGDAVGSVGPIHGPAGRTAPAPGEKPRHGAPEGSRRSRPGP